MPLEISPLMLKDAGSSGVGNNFKIPQLFIFIFNLRKSENQKVVYQSKKENIVGILEVQRENIYFIKINWQIQYKHFKRQETYIFIY